MFDVNSNWIEGRNPYKLAAPSAWWLKLLFDYDAQLVVMPSVKDCVYRLCRRVSRDRRLGLSQMHVHEHPDTVQMIQNGLVPVASMTTWSVQSDKIIRDLMARDTWKNFGPDGADSLVDLIEYNEAKADERADALMREQFDQVSGEAFRSLQFRNGSAVAQVRQPQKHRDKLPKKRRADRTGFAPLITNV